jgi:hypothetical protein
MDEGFVELRDPSGKDVEPPKSEVMEFFEWLSGQFPGNAICCGLHKMH